VIPAPAISDGKREPRKIDEWIRNDWFTASSINSNALAATQMK
jgi:hypothetical protein